MNSPADPALLSLEEIAAAIREGRTTSVAATEACLARIDAHEEKVNSIINLERATALEAAHAADAALARGEIRGPLHGVPLAHKECTTAAVISAPAAPRSAATTFRT